MTLKEYQQLYQDVFEKSPLGIYTLTSEGVIDSFNPKMVELAGAKKSDNVIGLNVFEMETYKKAGLDKYFKKGLNGKSFEVEVAYTSYTGKRVSHRHYRGVPIYNAKNEVSHLLLMVEDVTKRKANETLLEDRAKEIEALAKFPSQAPFPILRVDVSGLIMYANDASLPVLNHWRVHTGQHVPQEILDQLTHIAQTNAQALIDVAVDDRVFSFVIAPFVREQYFNFYGRDVTRERQIEQIKTDFVTLTSHQLRTPLTGIKWYVELLQKGSVGDLTHAQQEYVNNISGINNQLINLVNDLLSVSQIETGDRFRPERYELDIVPILRSTVGKVYSEHGESRHITIAYTKPFPQRLVLYIDGHLISEAIQNVIANAIKYSADHSTVTIGFKYTENNTMAVFSIHDNGMGIPESQKERVFEKFFRADNVMTAQIQGTGLGLYISKAIIERHRGKIWFESSKEKGTTFFIALPLVGK